MTLRFFQNVQTVADLRKEYVRLLKVYHPDNGGDLETCKAINTEYDYLVGRLPKDETGKATTSKEDIEIDQELRDIINKIVRFEGLKIEVVGTWIWCDGNSYPYKEELKGLGFQWSRARKKWHFTPYESAWHKGHKKDFNELRSKYGSTKVENERVAAIA